MVGLIETEIRDSGYGFSITDMKLAQKLDEMQITLLKKL
jgi:hypothetical protein